MNTRKPVVLLAPLDWGLGHTVRCIPIIRKLLSRGCEIIVACNSKQRLFLEGEFDNIRFVELPGYNVSYGRTRLQTILKLILQIPGILTVINQEQKWLQTFLSTQQVDAIISDNRYGLSSEEVPSIFITHQLSVKSGLGNLINNSIQKRLYRYVNRFSACWIPDWADKLVSAAAELSHPERLPSTMIQYIGCVSRLDSCTDPTKVNDLLIILSGPEPQRTIFENILLLQLRSFAGSVVLVRGVLREQPISSFDRVKILDCAFTKELNSLMCNSTAIICRSGYTSVMDLIKVGKKSILVPTPGQAEQEYLATHMEQRKIAVTMKQNDFDLQIALEKLKSLRGALPGESMDQYEVTLDKLVNSLEKGG